MNRFRIYCLTVIGCVSCLTLIWISGPSGTARGEVDATDATARPVARARGTAKRTTQVAKEVDGVSQLILVLGKPQTEVIKTPPSKNIRRFDLT